MFITISTKINLYIYEYQSGFLPRHSTVHQLLEIYNSILNSLENKEANCFVFCDFSKAFDQVWHRGLLHKMKAYGITGNLIDWYSSYLKGRRQKVVIKNNSSAYCEISAGVPQVSVLGPLLFIIYINDIADKLVSLSRLFADDTSFGYSNQDTMQLKNVIDHDLNEMDLWSKKWLMSFNPDKTEIMIFSNRSIPENLDFSFNGKSVPITTSYKHLGVTFSNDAKWKTHVHNSVSKHLNILRRLKYRRTNLDKLYLVNMPVNYRITVGLGIHKNWNNFNWKLPGLLQAYLFSQKLKFYI